MTAAPSSIHLPAYILKIIGGPDKGASFKMVSGKATLGRESGNDINLNDARCSHHHVAVLIQNDQIFVKDMGSRNGILLNGKKVTESMVRPGEPLQIGDTVFVIQKEAPIMASVGPSAPSQTYAGPTSMNLPREKEKNSTLIVIGVTIIAVVGFLLISQGTKKKKSDYGLKTEEQVNAELEDIEKQKTELSRQKVSSAQFSEQGKEAQAAYLQGFRDYREGNFSRAIQSFTAALALLPDHTLAQQYKKLAERRLDELVQFNLIEGKRNMEQNKYEMARSHYRNVIVLLNDQTNKLYQEANGQLQVIDLLLTGRY
jgi:pSer/pThr/pTyr-binding forkhead associated (FHA) protein